MKAYFIFKENGDKYGWTSSKNILKIFLKQRNKKYHWKKVDYLWIKKNLDFDEVINYIIIPSAKLNKKVKLFMTLRELLDVELWIHDMFAKLCSFKEYEDKNGIIDIFLSLKPKYLIALETIGFHPTEVKERCNEYPANSDDIAEILQDIYGANWMMSDIIDNSHIVPGASYFKDRFHQCIYSLETFIKILIDELRG